MLRKEPLSSEKDSFSIKKTPFNFVFNIFVFINLLKIKETVEIFKQLLDEHNAEFFFDCYKITKDSVKTTHWREIENYAMKMTKEKYKL